MCKITVGNMSKICGFAIKTNYAPKLIRLEICTFIFKIKGIQLS
jgi:hypothetical protein